MVQDKVIWQVEVEEWQATEKNFITALTQIATIAKKRTKIGVTIQKKENWSRKAEKEAIEIKIQKSGESHVHEKKPFKLKGEIQHTNIRYDIYQLKWNKMIH
ncbi:39684_t:CDS:2 [Gigaspora margarita]|uniref:39684_t:CDS:1 n=1 Tax=Gigaspora margarita TaxID=4874 RepID=A0ABN7W6G1_GIGMA|nr:39684_t:CDS:2 [Gigaspora margarita]